MGDVRVLLRAYNGPCREDTRHLSEKKLVDLTWAIAAINGWNRIAISCGVVPGSYKAGNQPE